MDSVEFRVHSSGYAELVSGDVENIASLLCERLVIHLSQGWKITAVLKPATQRLMDVERKLDLLLQPVCSPFWRRCEQKRGSRTFSLKEEPAN